VIGRELEHPLELLDGATQHAEVLVEEAREGDPGFDANGLVGARIELDFVEIAQIGETIEPSIVARELGRRARARRVESERLLERLRRLDWIEILFVVDAGEPLEEPTFCRGVTASPISSLSTSTSSR
jgi:hypothetical protein